MMAALRHSLEGRADGCCEDNMKRMDCRSVAATFMQACQR